MQPLVATEHLTKHYKDVVAERYAEMVYYGKWFNPLRRALDAFADSTQQDATGNVTMKLYKGNCIPVGRKSENSLYQESFATFEEDEVYNQADAAGFIKLNALRLQIEALKKK